MREQLFDTGRATGFIPVAPLLANEDAGLRSLLGSSVAMQRLYAQIRRIAPTKASVMIEGETGTGKELVARTIHQLSSRSAQPFVVVKCATLTASNVAAEVFGEEASDFYAGAVQRRVGHLERAQSGTVYFADIARMPLEVQATLAKALESRAFTRIGGDREIAFGCRVLAGVTDAKREVADGQLLPELLYRIAVFPMSVPALRLRGDDSELLAQHFLDALNRAEGTSKQLSAESSMCIKQHPWLGNVRELRNAIERAFILGEEEIDVREALDEPPLARFAVETQAVSIPVGTALAEAERWLIMATLKKCGGNKTRAAAVLGVSLKTLYNRLNEYRTRGLKPLAIGSEQLAT